MEETPEEVLLWFVTRDNEKRATNRSPENVRRLLKALEEAVYGKSRL